MVICSFKWKIFIDFNHIISIEPESKTAAITCWPKLDTPYPVTAATKTIQFKLQIFRKKIWSNSMGLLQSIYSTCYNSVTGLDLHIILYTICILWIIPPFPLLQWWSQHMPVFWKWQWPFGGWKTKDVYVILPLYGTTVDLKSDKMWLCCVIWSVDFQLFLH